MAVKKGGHGGKRPGAGRPRGKEDRILAELKKQRADLRTEAQKHADKALAKIAELVDHEDARVALAASTEIIDRAYGKATQYSAPENPVDGLSDGAISTILSAAIAERALRLGSGRDDFEAIEGDSASRTTH